MRPKSLTYIALALLIAFTGCTTYARFTGDFRTDLAARNYDAALIHLGEAGKSGDKLLCLLENGLVAHYQMRYETSNRYFAAAERLSDERYTRSISHQAAALITNDAVRKYRGESFEMVAIHYYRALNYWYLGLPEDALVECRKANLKLARYAIHNGEKSYKNDAFIHYMTGLFYEATGELNDAYISYQHARDAYAHYAETLGVSPPASLSQDLQRVEDALNGDGPNVLLASLDINPFLAPAGDGELVVFSEIGFVPRKIQEEIDLPIYETDIKRGKRRGLTVVSNDIAGRYRHRRDTADIEYWLRVALPKYETTRPRTQTVRLRVDGSAVNCTPAQNFTAIARATFEDRFPGILGRTVVRSFAKYLTYRKADKKNRVLGFFANLFNVSTEVADTRSWVSLPHGIQIGRIHLPPGEHTVAIETLDAAGHIIESKTFGTLEIAPGQRTFLSHRFYE